MDKRRENEEGRRRRKRREGVLRNRGIEEVEEER